MVTIPDIADDVFADLSARVKPVGRFSRRITSTVDEVVPDSEGDLYVTPSGGSFVAKKRPGAEVVQICGLQQIAEVPTLHTYRMSGGKILDFDPLAREVFAHIPEQYRSRVAYFEVHFAGFFGSTLHKGKLILYERMPEPQA